MQARKHAKHVSTQARKHAKHASTQARQARDLADSLWAKALIIWETAYVTQELQYFNHQIQSRSISQVVFKHFEQEQKVAFRRRLFT